MSLPSSPNYWAWCYFLLLNFSSSASEFLSFGSNNVLLPENSTSSKTPLSDVLSSLALPNQPWQVVPFASIFSLKSRAFIKHLLHAKA